MMRSLWTAASGMSSQQMNVDTISNNIANVNTYGYKKERTEFSTLLYQTLQRADLDPANPGGRPVNLQIGSGVRPIATARLFSMGALERTEQPLDFAIEGNAFFSVRISPLDQGDEQIAYTRDGSFKVSPTEEGLMLVTSLGYPILSTEEEPIIIPEERLINDISIESNGTLVFQNEEGETEELGFRIDLIQFQNVQGLESIGRNLYKTTPATGDILKEADADLSSYSSLTQGYLEMSNVNIADEMVSLIVAQRAYELNSKAIQTSDSMLQEANNLKRG